MKPAFFDSNVLLYTITRDDDRRSAAQTIVGGGGFVSVQCLNEFISVATRKLGLPHVVAEAARDDLLCLLAPPLPLTIDLHLTGVRLAQRHQLSIYDGMIVAAALAAECVILYSEDMHAGLMIDGRLRIGNPFA